VGGRELAVLLAEVFAQRLEPLRRVDQLYLAATVLRLAVREDPHVCRDARVVKHVQRQGNDRLEPVVLDDVAADVALALTRVPSEERAAVMHLGDPSAELRPLLHLRDEVREEEHLPVA
jgi:hypothetical protein